MDFSFESTESINFKRENNFIRDVSWKPPDELEKVYLYHKGVKTDFFYYINPRFRYLFDYLEVEVISNYKGNVKSRIENSFPIIFPKYICYYYDNRMDLYISYFCMDSCYLNNIYTEFNILIEELLGDYTAAIDVISRFKRLLRNFDNSILKLCYLDGSKLIKTWGRKFFPENYEKFKNN